MNWVCQIKDTSKTCRTGGLQDEDWEALADCELQDYYVGLNCNKHHFIICASDEKHDVVVKISYCYVQFCCLETWTFYRLSLRKAQSCALIWPDNRSFLMSFVGFYVVVKALDIPVVSHKWNYTGVSACRDEFGNIYDLTPLCSLSVRQGNEKSFLPVYSHYVSLGRVSLFLMGWTIEPHRDQGSDAVQGL